MKFRDNTWFRDFIRATHQRLLKISEQASLETIRDGGWSRKQILGHLIDSALNNHQRFVRAALEGVYQGPSYEQNGWVAMHGYAALNWGVLVEHWLRQNELLAEVVERIPPDRLAAQCTVGKDAPVTLEFLVADYLNHMDHHVAQIATSA